MSQKIEEIVKNVLSLPINSRAYIAEVLLESLDLEEGFPLSYIWMNEIKKRCNEIDESKVQLVGGMEGLEQLHRKYF
ncbi:MAG: addiction module protein [Nitrospirae bacterium]|nr:addiction module protein [Nitrospirota bacterium]MBF0542621.1 addiction module protein [Nitrospirota bacterium]